MTVSLIETTTPDGETLEVQPPCEVLPDLWLSGLPHDWAELRRLVDTVVDVADPGPPPTAAQRGPVRWVKQPLVDGDELPDVAVLDELVRLVAGEHRAGRRVLVHCTYGKNRSGLLMTLVVRELLGCDGRTALEHVRSVRDRAVNNEGFAAWVSSLPAPR